MVTRLVYNNTAFKIINSYNFTQASDEVSFSDITIDFTGYTKDDIPYKYQEIKIKQSDNEENIIDEGDVLFTGFVDEITFGTLQQAHESRELTLTLLSPLKMATKRCVTLIGTYNLTEALERILEPLINDGFVITGMVDVSGQITTSYVLETIEQCMNEICNKRNLFWFINPQKEIYICSLDYLFGLTPVKTIDESIKEEGLYRIEPKIQNVDYANILNFKNVRLVYSQIDISIYDYYEPTEKSILKLPQKLKSGDTVEFNNPIIISEEWLNQYCQEEYGEVNPDNYPVYCLYLRLESKNNQYDFIIGNFTKNGDYGWNTEGNISYSTDEDDEDVDRIVLQTDSFFSNLVTGFKLELVDDDNEYEVFHAQSATALRYTTMRFMFSEEIEKMKGIISDTGQVEKTIDYNETWTTLPQLIQDARSMIVQNNNYISEITLEYDVDPGLNVGDLITINMDSYYCNGQYAVVSIKYNYNNDLDESWTVKVKDANLNETFIDLFRPSVSQESESNVLEMILNEYIEETTSEVHSAEQEGINITKDEAIQIAKDFWAEVAPSQIVLRTEVVSLIDDIYTVELYGISSAGVYRVLAYVQVDAVTGEVIEL